MADRRVVLSFVGNTTSLRRSFAEAKKSTEEFQGTVTRVTGGLQGFGREAVRLSGLVRTGVAASFAAAGAALVKSSVDFDSAMRNVTTISRAARDDFAGVSDQILDLSRTLPQSAATLARGLYDVASAGFDGAEGLEIVTRSAEAASAGLSTTDVAARAITATLNAYGMNASQAADVSDVLFQTVNLGVVTFEELAQNMGDVVGAAATAGVEFDELGAALATITLSGVPAAEAATSLNAVMRAMIKPSEQLADLFNQWGYESGQAALQAVGLQGVMERIGDAVEGDAEALQELLPEIRGARGAFGLLAQDGAIFARVAGEITDESARMGATQAALDEQSKSLAFQFGRLRNNVQATAIEVGQRAAPVMAGLLGTIQNLGSALADRLGPALTGVAGFLSEHRELVMALALAYTATLVPAAVAAAVSFARLSFARIAATIDLAVTSVRVLALEMGALRLAVASIGWVAAIAVLVQVTSALTKTRTAGEDLIATLEQDLDLTVIEDIETGLGRVQTALDEKRDQMAGYANPVKAALTEIVQVIGWGEEKIHDTRDAVQDLEAEEERLLGLQARRAFVLDVVADQTGLTTDKILALAKANGVNLYGDTQKAIVALRNGARATLFNAEATKQAEINAKAAADAQEDFADAITGAVKASSVYTSALSALKTGEKDRIDALEERHRAERAALEGEKITGTASQAAHNRRMENLEERQKAEKAAAETSVKANSATTLSMEQYRRAIAENTKTTRQWLRNLTVIASRGGDELRNQLASLGPEAAGLVAEVATSSDKELDRFKTTMAEGGETATEALIKQYEGVPEAIGEIGRHAGDAFADNIAEGFRRGTLTLEQLIEKAQALQNELVSTGEGTFRPRGGGPTAAFAEGHVAQIAPAGSWRLWAEPETGGEAYIPLAHSKRARSTALVADVARRFGYGLVPMAEGGMWAVPASARVGGQIDPALVRALGRLEQRLARGGGQIGQVVFQEKIDPLHAAQKISWAMRGA